MMCAVASENPEPGDTPHNTPINRLPVHLRGILFRLCGCGNIPGSMVDVEC